ncbi:MAG: DUF92 domain-containing protein [Anaerolineae bacterium]
MMAQLLAAAFFSGIVAALAWWRGSLSPSGAAGATLVGALIFVFGGWQWGVFLLIFFVSSSALSHFKEAEKQAAAEKFDKGHTRDVGQVLANGGLGSAAAVMSALAPSPLWLPFFVGVMATVTADTWATELGTLSRKPPRLITNGRVVEVGTSGGVSLLGTAVSLAGGLLIGASGGFLAGGRPFWLLLGTGALSGLFGSLFDSLLGATVQQIYYCEVCRKETERKVHKCGHHTHPLRGWPWLNNDLVNFLASLVGGLIAASLSLAMAPPTG